MDTSKKLLNPTFVNAFNCRFNSDLIDEDDTEDLLDLADTVVSDLMARKVSVDDILSPLTKAIANWGPAVLDEFSAASNGNWSYDAEGENTLRLIIDRMIDTARGRIMSVRAAE